MAFSGLQSHFTLYLFFLSTFFLTVGWASDGARGFGEQAGVKTQILNIIHSTRTIMRSKLNLKFIFIECIPHKFYNFNKHEMKILERKKQELRRKFLTLLTLSELFCEIS